MFCEAEVKIKNSDGLHMRPAMEFVDLASQFKSDIRVTSPEYTVDGKSIMQMTMLAATQGTRLKIRAEGPDCEKAVGALQELLEQKLTEAAAQQQKEDSSAGGVSKNKAGNDESG